MTLALRRRRWLTGLLLSPTACATALGCYRYTPIDTAPEPGREVRVDLTDAGSLKLAPYIGPRIEALDGRALQSTDSSLVLAVKATIGRSGESVSWSDERLDVPTSAIARLRGRQLDRGRTWMVSGLGVIGVVLLGEAFGMGHGFDGLIGRGRGGSGKQ
jgi:hypothetical protein